MTSFPEAQPRIVDYGTNHIVIHVSTSPTDCGRLSSAVPWGAITLEKDASHVAAIARYETFRRCQYPLISLALAIVLTLP